MKEKKQKKVEVKQTDEAMFTCELCGEDVFEEDADMNSDTICAYCTAVWKRMMAD